MIKTTVNNNTTTTNIRKTTCKCCGRTLEKNQGIKVYSRNVYGFLCSDCSTRMNGSYSTENSTRINNETKTNNCTISIELEISTRARYHTTEKELQWLTNEANFLKTPDGSVWYEFKSPIYNNLLGLSKILSNFEKLNKLNQWNNATDYGTHLNIGNSELTVNNLKIVKRFYHSLFVPFCEYLQNNPEKTTALHGRNFTHYASTINYNSRLDNNFGGNYMQDDHCYFINMQHSTHIEFRLCKLVTAKQYMLLARMYQDIIQKVICDYFLARYDETATAETKKALAKKASQKMIKIFNKYYNKLTNQ